MGRSKKHNNAEAEKPDVTEQLAKQVESLRALAATDPEICVILGTGPERLDELKTDPRIAAAYERGRILADQRVTESLFQSAVNGSVPAQLAWLAARMPDRWGDGKAKQNRGRTPEQTLAATESATSEATVANPPDVPADPNALPPHLGAAGRRHWLAVVTEFAIEAHDLPLLQQAAEALDELATLQRQLTDTELTAAEGERIQRMISRSRGDFRKIQRELGLNQAAPGDTARPPAIAPRNFRLMGA